MDRALDILLVMLLFADSKPELIADFTELTLLEMVEYTLENLEEIEL